MVESEVRILKMFINFIIFSERVRLFDYVWSRTIQRRWVRCSVIKYDVTNIEVNPYIYIFYILYIGYISICVCIYIYIYIYIYI